MEWLTGLGPFAVLVVFAGYIIWKEFSGREKSSNGNASYAQREEGKAIRDIQRKISQLHEWHNKEDEDGVKIWYIRRSLENAINKLADNLEKQTELLQRLIETDKDVSRDVKDLKNKLDE